MNFMNQLNPKKELEKLADSDRHSILIEGPEGVGKSYLAIQFAGMLNILDFQTVQPKVDEIKSTVDACLRCSTPIVICIENLDMGVKSAAYALLKFLEEPLPNTYIVVTCRNIKHVPDTIISRSVVVSVPPPTMSDIEAYAVDKNNKKFKEVSASSIWRCVHTFKDVDTVLSMTQDNINYFTELSDIVSFKDTISNLVWRISHYPDKSECPVNLAIRCIMNLLPTNHVMKSGVECLNDLESRKMAPHAVLAKFMFELKYCE